MAEGVGGSRGAHGQSVKIIQFVFQYYMLGNTRYIRKRSDNDLFFKTEKMLARQVITAIILRLLALLARVILYQGKVRPIFISQFAVSTRKKRKDTSQIQVEAILHIPFLLLANKMSDVPRHLYNQSLKLIFNLKDHKCCMFGLPL